MGGGLVPGGRGGGKGDGDGGVVGGDPALMGGGLVPGGRGGGKGDGDGGVVGGDPARITELRFGSLDDVPNCCWNSCLVTLWPKTPRARSATISPTVRVIASATAFSDAPPWVLVRCSKLASSSLSGTLRMRSSHNRVPERLSIISRAVIGLLPVNKHTDSRTGQSGEARALQPSKTECEREVLIEHMRSNVEENPYESMPGLFLRHGADQRLEDFEAVYAAKLGFARAFRMRHHAKHVAPWTADAGDIV
jgi:hypothetical protein